jgi:hypothetical protein
MRRRKQHGRAEQQHRSCQEGSRHQPAFVCAARITAVRPG